MFAVAPGVSRSRAARPHVFGAASCWTPQHTSSRWEVESWLCRSVWRRVGGFGPCESALRLVTLGFQVPAREVPGGPLSTSVRFSKSTFAESGAWSNGLPARPWWRAAQSAVPCGLMAVCQDRAASKGQPGCPVAGVAGWPGAGVPRSSEVTRRHCPPATPGLSPGTAERLASECVGLCSVGPIVPGCCVPVGRAGLLEGEGCGPKVPFLWSLFKATGSPTSSTTSSFGSLTGKGGGRSPLMTSSRAASSCRYRAPEGGVSLWGRGFLLVPRGERCCPRPWQQRQLPPPPGSGSGVFVASSSRGRGRPSARPPRAGRAWSRVQALTCSARSRTVLRCAPEKQVWSCRGRRPALAVPTQAPSRCWAGTRVPQTRGFRSARNF